MSELEKLKRELELAYSEIAKKARELAEKDIQFAEKDIQFAEMNKKILFTESISIWLYFQESTLLPTLIKTGSASGPSTGNKENHKEIHSIKLMEFGLLSVDAESIEHCKLRQTEIFLPQNSRLKYGSENDVAVHVRKVISDITTATGLENKFDFMSELAISRLRADIWILLLNGFPVSVIEVKKPGEINEGKKAVIYGQLYDYMMKLRSFHGLCNVIGILTNFEQWEICCLPDSVEGATATSLNYGKHQIQSLPVENEKRILYKSKTYTYKNCKELAIALYSALKKIAYNSKYIVPVPLLGKSRAYICATEESWFWVSTLPNIEELVIDMPTEVSKKYYFLRDFHGGADGRVWMACSPSGNLVVIKFLDGDKMNELLVDQEVEHWHNLDHVNVFKTLLINRWAIVMPFAFVYNEDLSINNSWWKAYGDDDPPIRYFKDILNVVERIDPFTALSSCIEGCYKARLIHEDIEWRHVGLFPTISFSKSSALDLGKIRIDCKYSFIDLTNMTDAKTEGDARENMKKREEEILNNSKR